jgi:hypothetical protein
LQRRLEEMPAWDKKPIQIGKKSRSVIVAVTSTSKASLGERGPDQEPNDNSQDETGRHARDHAPPKRPPSISTGATPGLLQGQTGVSDRLGQEQQSQPKGGGNVYHAGRRKPCRRNMENSCDGGPDAGCWK